MKVQILQEDLSKIVSTAVRFVSTRSTLPILGNFLLIADKTKLKLSATNLEVSITCQIGAKVEEEGTITVPAKNFTEIITNLNRGQIDIDSKKEELTINASNFKGNILVSPSNDFPTIPGEIDKTKSFTLSVADIKKTLSKVIEATSSDESRPVLTGVLFIFEEDNLILVASDGFRLSKKNINLSKEVNLPKHQMIVPRASLLELIKMATDLESIDLEPRFEDNQLVIRIGDSYLTTRLIDGNFPDFEKIIPKSSTTSLVVDKNDLQKAVRLASVFAREEGNVIKLIISEKGIAITSGSAKVGSEEGNIEAKVEGSGLEISFNYKFIENFLGLVEGDSVEIKLTDGISPAIFVDPNDKDFLHLIMPVRIQN